MKIKSKLDEPENDGSSIELFSKAKYRTRNPKIYETHSACFEPVATVPAHRRRGLGEALLTEGLRRLQRMGATRAFVGGYSTAANALYGSVMEREYALDEVWVKEWSP